MRVIVSTCPASVEVGFPADANRPGRRRPWASLLVGHLAKVNHLRQLLLAASIVLLSESR